MTHPHFQLGFLASTFQLPTGPAVLEFHWSLQKMCRDMLRREVLRDGVGRSVGRWVGESGEKSVILGTQKYTLEGRAHLSREVWRLIFKLPLGGDMAKFPEKYVING